MVCIYCEQKTVVTNSRRQKRRNTTWRRRQCAACNAVFTSIESPDLTSSLVVSKKSSHIEPFQRDILMLSIYDSLKHRKNALQEASDLTDTVIQQIITSSNSATIDTLAISLATEKILARFDNAAAVHYRAYFLD